MKRLAVLNGTDVVVVNAGGAFFAYQAMYLLKADHGDLYVTLDAAPGR